MATKLLCPECRQELPGSFGQGEAGVCPKCRSNFAAPQVKAPRKSAVILRSQPFLPPPVEETKSFVRIKWLPYAAGAIGLLVIVGALLWWTMPPAAAPGSRAPNPILPAPKAPVAASTSSTPLELAPNLAPQSTTNPRARPAPKIDPTSAAPAPLASKSFSSAIEQERVEQAIRRGVEFLITHKDRWLNVGSHDVGYAALPALALLEAGVAGDEPAIEEAAALIRRKAPKVRDTYDIALAILFLDRLGADSDKTLIRRLSLRLVAAQSSQYGWGYTCPPLAPELEMPLQTMLEKLQPEGRWQAPLGREPGQGLVVLAMPLDDKRSAAGTSRISATMPAEPNLVKSMPLGDADRATSVVKQFPPTLQGLPVVQPMPTSAGAKSGAKLRGGGQDDNSNTQFALLALWTARRHGVPVDRSLLLSDHRFANSQLGDGSWGYRVGDGSRPSMTTVGLLALALGHGALLPDDRSPNQPAPRGGADAAIQRGLEALGRSIGHPVKRDHAPTPNLYFLWSVERVAMLYQLPTIGGKDWYGWGANELVASQRPDGAWAGSEYHGSAPPLDTAFALLFLRRSNLVPDLTERLQLHMAITDPERR
jgi:hypothetical protein